jgi:hypothetical protein
MRDNQLACPCYNLVDVLELLKRKKDHLPMRQDEKATQEQFSGKRSLFSLFPKISGIKIQVLNNEGLRPDY